MSAIVSATDAIKLASSTIGENPDQPKPAAQGRHWSFYVLATGSAIGLVCGVAALALKVYAVVVVGAVLFVTSGIGAYYVQKFALLTQLDDYVILLADKVKKLATTITDLRKTNDGLKKTAQDLSVDLKKANDAWKNGAASIESKAKELDETAKKLAEAQNKLEKMQGLYVNIQKAVATFSTNVGELAKSNISFNADLAKLADEIKVAFDVSTKLDSENKQFDANNEVYDRMNKMNLEFLQILEKDIGNIMKLKVDADKVVKPIEATSVALSNVSTQIEGSIHKIEDMESKETKLWDGTQNLDNAIGAVTKALQDLANKK